MIKKKRWRKKNMTCPATAGRAVGAGFGRATIPRPDGVRNSTVVGRPAGERSGSGRRGEGGCFKYSAVGYKRTAKYGAISDFVGVRAAVHPRDNPPSTRIRRSVRYAAPESRARPGRTPRRTLIVVMPVCLRTRVFACVCARDRVCIRNKDTLTD